MTKRALALLVIPAIVSLTLAGPAAARSVTAIGGVAASGISATCINVSTTFGYVSLASGCSTLFLQVGLPTDSSGSKTVVFSTRPGGTASAARCRARAVSRDTNVNNVTPLTSATVANAWQTVTLAAVTVPSNGYLLADCDLPTSVQYNNFTY